MPGQREKEGPQRIPTMLETALANYLAPLKPQETGKLTERQVQEEKATAVRRAFAEAIASKINPENPEPVADGVETLLIAIENKTGSNPGI